MIQPDNGPGGPFGAILDRVRAHCGDRVVVDHERFRGTNRLASDPAHVRAASVLRQQYWHRRTSPGDHLQVDVEVDDLSAYDAAVSESVWMRSLCALGCACVRLSTEFGALNLPAWSLRKGVGEVDSAGKGVCCVIVLDPGL